MDKAEEIREKILKNCFLCTDNDSDEFLSTIISNISKVMAEEIQKLEKALDKKKNFEHKKRGSSNPYDTSINKPRNLSRGPG